MSIITTDTPSPQPFKGDRERRRFACEERVPTLYKFTPFNTPERRRWVSEILLPPHRIYFAASSQLNDPFDLKPLLRLPSGISERELRVLLTTDAEQHWARQPPSDELLAIYRARLRTIDLQQLERESEERVHQRIEEHYGVFSLACELDRVEMWNEYADQRRGLCIHFRADAFSPFGFAQRVLYQLERSVLPLPLPAEREVADRALLTKSATRWEKECEYRLLRYPENVYEAAGLRVEGRYGYFRPDAVTGITVGTDMPPSDVEVIKSFAGAFDPPLPLDRPRLVALPNDRPTREKAPAFHHTERFPERTGIDEQTTRD
ncbi:MAG TPA: hypothetical protein VET46_15895 [Steroidobacteraceae bacterium]|nr:hypothetical protein [Steroidobacteraceae bacterium]